MTFNAAGRHANGLERLGVTHEEALEIVEADHVDGEISTWGQDSVAVDVFASISLRSFFGPTLGNILIASSDFDPCPAAVGERCVGSEGRRKADRGSALALAGHPYGDR